MNSFYLALIISTLLSCIVAFYAWRRQPAPGAKAVAIFMLGAAIWSFGYAMEFINSDLAAKVFWAKVQYIGIVTVPTWMLIIAIEYRRRDNWLTPRNQLLFTIEPLIVLIITWTNEWHGWLWQKTYLIEDSIVTLGLEYGWAFWVNVSYSYLLLLIGFVLILQSFLRAPKFYRAQTSVMLISTLIPWIGNALYQFDLSPFPGLDLTPFAFTLTGIGATWGFFRLQLMDITPVAYFAVFESISDGVIVLDAQARIIGINPAAQALIGIPEDEIIAKPAGQVLASWPNLLNRPEDEFIKEEIAMQISDGQQRFFDLTITPLYNRRKSLTARIILLHDISDLKQMETELVVARDQALDASRLKSQILTDVSHDMRTPLGAIVGYTEMLRTGIFGEVTTEQDEKLQDVLINCNQLSDFVNNLLAQSEIRSGELHIKKQPVSLQILLRESQSVIRLVAKQKGLQLKSKIAPEMPGQILGDYYWLRRILSNLLNNAIKYTDEGRIDVQIFTTDMQQWAIQVADTGIGISEEAQTYIFEPFRKGDQATLGYQRTGTGLGLSIVKEIVSQMKGQLELESEVGKGSVFRVYLPLYLPQKEENYE